MQRRKFLQLGAGAFGLGFISPNIAFANAATDTRFIFILQRGAADGLNTLIPYGDPNYKNLRKEIAIDNGLKLDGLFALHPAMVNTHKLWENSQASFYHAIASPYRERSHFDGQNILEGGFSRAYEMDDGWLNRFLNLLPQTKEPIAFAPTIPLALRGKNSVTSYAPSKIPDANQDLMLRVASLYENDAKLYDLWLKAQATKDMAEGLNGQSAEQLGKMVASFLIKPEGPRIAMIETQGWDTHSAQNNRLNTGLKNLDIAIGAIKDGLGEDWNKTIIMIATEFGRTAHVNGTNGTDHGTASCAIVLGGAIKGRKINADWPGLSQSNLYEGRDLKPTANLFKLIADTLGKGYKIDPSLVSKTIFPKLSV